MDPIEESPMTGSAKAIVHIDNAKVIVTEYRLRRGPIRAGTGMAMTM